MLRLWMILVGFLLLYVSFGTCQTGIPIPDFTEFTLSIRNDIHRFTYQLPKKTFIDPQDGDIDNLQLDWLTEFGQNVPPTNWIQLNKQTKALIGYLSPRVYDNYDSSKGYRYRLRATDSNGNFNTKEYIIKLIDSKPVEPFYIQTLSLETQDSLIYMKNNVEILFLIQETKLFKFYEEIIKTIGNITTKNLIVNKQNGKTEVTLEWSSTIFIHKECPINLINQFRSKTSEDDTSKYQRFFPPEFIVKNLGEYLQGGCDNFSLLPPIVGTVQWNIISVTPGEVFSVEIPNNIFISPEGKNMMLNIVIKQNGVEPSWVLITGNVMTGGAKLEGYITYNRALNQRMYNFEIIATTPFLMTAKRQFQISVTNFMQILDNYVISFTLIPANQITTNFFVNFATLFSSYLKISTDSFIIVDIIINGNEVILNWTTKEITDCNSWQRIRSLIVDEQGNLLPALQNLIQNIGVTLTTINFPKDDFCVDKPVPDSSSHTIRLNNRGFWFTYALPKKTFIDKQDGDIDNLKIELLTETKAKLDLSSWIQYDCVKKEIYGYSFAQLYGISLYTFFLKATDSDGNFAFKTIYIQLLNEKPIVSTYSQTLTLNAITQTVATRNNAYILRYLVTKLYAYNMQNRQGFNSLNSFTVENLEIDRSNVFLRVILTWGNVLFESDICPIQAIIQYRKPIADTAKYFEIFREDYTVSGLAGQLKGACSDLSLKPPILNSVSWSTLQITFNMPFSFPIPKSLFQSPQGSNMQLTLQLRNLDGSIVKRHDWLYLFGTSIKDGISLKGLTTYDITSSSRRYGYNIVAMTPFLMEASQEINLEIINFKAMTFDWSVILQSKTSSVNFGEWAPIFQQKMSSFLNVEPLSIVIIYFRELSYCFEIKFAINRALSCSDITQYNKRLAIGKQPTSELNLIMNEISFPLLSIVIQSNTQCTGPYIINSLQTLRFRSFETFYRYFIPANSYTHSSGLPLQYVIEYKNNFLPQNWIAVDSQKIYGVPIAKYLENGKTYKFNLKIFDSLGNSIVDEFSIIVESNPPNYSYLYNIRFQYTKIYSSIAVVMYEFMMKLLKYYGDINRNDLIVDDVIAQPAANIIDVYYYNKSFESIKCDRKAHIQNNIKLFKGKIANPLLISSLQPEFQVLDVKSSRNKNCNVNLIPIVNLKYFYENKQVLGPFQIRWGEYFFQQIQTDLFRDEEDGFTRDLYLQLDNTNGIRITKTDWLFLNSSTQTLYAVPTDQTFLLLQYSTHLTYILTAYDKDGAALSIEYIFTPSAWIKTNYFHVVFTVNVFGIAHFSYARQLLTLIPKFEKLLGETYINKICIRSFKLLSQNKEDGNVEIVWIPCDFTNETCDLNKIQMLQNILFTSEGNINSRFLGRDQNFQITNIKTHIDSVCSDDNIKITQIPILRLSYCSNIFYRISADTFVDSIDGNSRNLRLEILNTDGTSLKPRAPIFFDALTQTVIFVPYNDVVDDVKDVDQLFPNRMRFLLQATTKRGKRATTPFMIEFNEKAKPYNFYFKISVKINNDVAIAKLLYDVQTKTGQYLGYSDVRVLKYWYTSERYLNIQITACRLGYPQCDLSNINSITDKILDISKENFNRNYRTTLLPTVDLLSVTIHKIGDCIINNNPPVQNKPIPTLIINMCSTFIYNIPPETFQDPEDGLHLTYSIIQINSNPIKNDLSWINADSGGKEIMGVINNMVLKSRRTNIIKIRAFDSGGLYVDANWEINIIGSLAQEHYVIILYLESKYVIKRTWMEAYHIARFINQFFKGNVTNAVNIRLIDDKNLEFSWSSCSLPTYCDANAASIFFMNMKIENSLVPKFVDAFSERYFLKDVMMRIQEQCQGPLNPPVPKYTQWNLNIETCGGSRITIPEDLFTDQEDGYARNLKLSLLNRNGNQIPVWLSLKESTQMLYAYPDLNEAKIHSNYPQTIAIKATDSSGLSTEINLNLIIKTRPEPKYLFNIRYNLQTSFENQLMDRLKFAEKLCVYIERPLSAIGLVKYTQSVSGYTEFVYGDCNIVYDPCDIIGLQNVKNKLFDIASGLVNSMFKQAMRTEYDITEVYTTIQYPCQDKQNSGPTIENEIGTINIPICSLFVYQVPKDTFFDKEDGNTRQLKLTLTSKNTDNLMSNSLIRFNEKEQSLHVIPTLYFKDLYPSGLQLILTATDSSKQSTSLNFKTLLVGEDKRFRECQIKMQFTTTNAESLFDTILQVLQNLKDFFVLSQTENLVIINYVKLNTNRFQLSWSFCNSANQFDREIFLRKILLKLYTIDYYGEKTVNTQVFNAFGKFVVLDYVEREFTGVCRNFPPIKRRRETEVIRLSLKPCGYSQYHIPNDMFVDFEDGGTKELRLSLYETNSQVPVSTESWVNLESMSQSIIAVFTKDVSVLSRDLYYFDLQARDQMNDNVTVEVIVSVNTEAIKNRQTSPFDFVYYLQATHQQYPLTYEIMYLIQRIKIYFQLNSDDDVYIRSYEIIPGITQSRKVVWTLCKSEPCSSKTYIENKRLSTLNFMHHTTNEPFLHVFLSGLIIRRVLYISSICDKPVTPPNPGVVIPTINIPRCVKFQYDLPKNIFVTNNNVSTWHMQIVLTNQLSQPIPRDSFVQYDVINHRIYGISVHNFVKNSPVLAYRLVGYDAAMQVTGVNINIEFERLIQNPKCPITIRFKYNFISRDLPYLDILWRFLIALEKYLNDDQIYVNNFFQDNDNSFVIVWSKCSETLSSNHEIMQIYAKLVDMVTNNVNIEFYETMKNNFLIERISISDSCLGNKPYPRNNLPIKLNISPCSVIKFDIPNDMFGDIEDKDVSNMRIEIAYPNGILVSKTEFIQVDSSNRFQKVLYGVPTEEIIAKQHSEGYKYLILCTDSSNLRASIELTITLSSIIDNKNHIIVGFQNKNQPANIARSLYDLTNQIRTFLLQNSVDTGIFIKTFLIGYMMEFSICNIACTQENWNRIFNLMQENRYITKPTLIFRTSLQNNYHVEYVYISVPQCLPNNNPQIVPQDCGNINFPQCGLFQYKIPENCFIDRQGLNTRQFLLTLQNQQNQWIELDRWNQTLNGVYIRDDVIGRIYYATIEAIHPISGSRATKRFEIEIKEDISILDLAQDICYVSLFIQAEFWRFANQFSVLSHVIEIITSFDITLPELQVKNFRVNDSANFEITYTYCEWYKLQNDSPQEMYQQTILKSLRKYFVFQKNGLLGLKSEFKNHMMPYFNVTQVTLSPGCYSNQTGPPIPGADITISLKDNCGRFSYIIPETTFLDGHLGNARNLKLTLLQLNGQKPDWISIRNNIAIYGIVNDAITRSQPIGGYRFILRAENNKKMTAEVGVTVIIPNVLRTTGLYRIRMVLSVNMISISVLEFQDQFLETVKNYEAFRNLQFSFDFTEFNLGSGNINTVSITYCDQCAADFFLTANSVKQNLNAFKAELNKNFTVFDVTFDVPTFDLYIEKCQGSFSPQRTSFEINFDFCSNNIVPLTRYYGDDINNYKVFMVSVSGQALPEDSWVNLIENPYEIIGFPKRENKINQPFSGYVFNLIITKDNVNLPGTRLLSVFINGNLGNTGVTYNIIIETTTSALQPEVYYIQQIWKGVQRVLGVNRMQHINITHLHDVQEFHRFLITWYFCDLPNNCFDVSHRNIISKVYSNGILRNDFIREFPELNILSFGGSCQNTIPAVPEQLVLNISECGYFVYNIPKAFAFDYEDGYADQLDFVLKNKDGSLLPRDSWIKLDPGKLQIISFPNKNMIGSLNTFEYFIHVTDSANQNAKTLLRVNIIENNEIYFEISFTLRITVLSNDLDIQTNFLNSLIKYIGRYSLKDIGIRSFMKLDTKDIYVLKIHFCNIKEKACFEDDKNLKEIKTMLATNDNQPTNNFQQYILTNTQMNIQPLVISFESKYELDTPPTRSENYENGFEIRVTHCDRKNFTVPENMFIDDFLNLEYMIYDFNNVSLTTPYWIEIYDDVINIAPFEYVQQGTYPFYLVTKDRCGSEAAVLFNVIVENSSPNVKYSIQQVFKNQEQLPTLYVAFTVLREIELCFENTGNIGNAGNLALSSVRIDNMGNAIVTWKNCSLQPDSCQLDSINEIRSVIYNPDGSVKARFRNCFQTFPQVSIRELTCADENSTNPVVKIPPQYTIRYCEKVDRIIDINTFYDIEDGDTRNLRLELNTFEMSEIKPDSFIQFDTEKQRIYGFPKTTLIAANQPSTYFYNLVATDRSGRSTTAVVTMTIADKPVTTNYAVSLTFARNLFIVQLLEIDVVIENMALLEKYFGSRINLVDYKKEGDTFEMQISFCELFYQGCDCEKIKTYKDMLTPVSNLQRFLREKYILTSISENYYNLCNDVRNYPRVFERPENNVSFIDRFLVGTYREVIIPDRTFYDEQEGFTGSLEVALQNNKKIKIQKNYWMTVNQNKNETKICVLMTLRDFNQWLLENGFEEKFEVAQEESDVYYFVHDVIAQDSCHFQTEIPQNSSILHYEYQHSLTYTLTMVLQENKDQLISNCTLLSTMVEKIGEYGIRRDIFIESIESANNTNFTNVIWGYRQLSQGRCENESLFLLRQQFFENFKVNPKFTQYMSPDFQVIDLKNETKGCTSALVEPETTDFDWWIIWLLGALALFFLLLWFLWLCCPRVCKGMFQDGMCAIGCCGPCRKCCAPDGNYSSFSGSRQNDDEIDAGVLAKPRDDEEKFRSEPKENTMSRDTYFSPVSIRRPSYPAAVAEEREIADLGETLAEPNSRPRSEALSKPSDEPIGGVLAKPRDSVDNSRALPLPNGSSNPFGDVLAKPRDSDGSNNSRDKNSRVLSKPRDSPNRRKQSAPLPQGDVLAKPRDSPESAMRKALQPNEFNAPRGDVLSKPRDSLDSTKRQLPQPASSNPPSRVLGKPRDSAEPLATSYEPSRQPLAREPRNMIPDSTMPGIKTEYKVDPRVPKPKPKTPENNAIRRLPQPRNATEARNEPVYSQIRRKSRVKDTAASRMYDRIPLESRSDRMYRRQSQGNVNTSYRRRVSQFNNTRDTSNNTLDALLDSATYTRRRKSSRHRRFKSDSDVRSREKRSLSRLYQSDYNTPLSPIERPLTSRRKRSVQTLTRRRKEPVVTLHEYRKPKTSRKKYKSFSNNQSDDSLDKYLNRNYTKTSQYRKTRRTSRNILPYGTENRKSGGPKDDRRNETLESILSRELYFTPKYKGRQVYARDKITRVPSSEPRSYDIAKRTQSNKITNLTPLLSSEEKRLSKNERSSKFRFNNYDDMPMTRSSRQIELSRDKRTRSFSPDSYV